MSGLFGVVSRNECYETLIFGTDYHSHLGTEFGGVALYGSDFVREIHHIGQSQFKSRFLEKNKRLPGNRGIGVISAFDEQPVFLHSRLGRFCLVTAGYIENCAELSEQLLAQGHSFAELSRAAVNMTELVARLISLGDTIVDGIERMYEVIQGSCTLLLLHQEGLYAACDRHGYLPLALGKRADAFAVASETCAFPNTGFKFIKQLAPGEIIRIDEQGLSQQAAGDHANQICSFLWVYTAFPASSFEGRNVEAVREDCGRALARRDRDNQVDVVSGVPDSGFAHAVGYAMESGKPFRRPLVKYTPGYGRSYTPPSQETRDMIATMKLLPVEEIIRNNRIVVCEDSIVRGTQLKNSTVKKLWESGAREIHVRPACPPLMFPCRFNLSTRRTHELVARRAIKSLEGKDLENISAYLDSDSPEYAAMVAWIAKDLEVTTLRYQTVADLVAAIGIPKERLCLYCWTGECPAGGCQAKKVTALDAFRKTGETRPAAANE